jgi:hypothetical protein
MDVLDGRRLRARVVSVEELVVEDGVAGVRVVKASLYSTRAVGSAAASALMVSGATAAAAAASAALRFMKGPPDPLMCLGVLLN